jgi:hypothetical protein
MDNLDDTYNEMLLEINKAIESMGGEVEEIDIGRKFIKISVADELEEEAYGVVEDILQRYEDKRKESIRNNPFFRAQVIKDDMCGKK